MARDHVSCWASFPGRSRRRKVDVKDYIAPPLHALVRSIPASETVWSLGEYIHRREIWQAFKLQGTPPRRVRHLRQSALALHRQGAVGVWQTCALARCSRCSSSAAIGLVARGPRKRVPSSSYSFSPSAGDRAFFRHADVRAEGPIRRTSRSDHQHRSRQQLGLLQLRADQRRHRPGATISAARSAITTAATAMELDAKAAATISVIIPRAAGQLLSARRARDGPRRRVHA